MPHDVIATCPVCEHELSVTRLHCAECGTTLEGSFSVGRFGRLNREQLALLESFLRSRGNLREMERELGLSYPTIRGRVEALVRALGLGGSAAADAEAPDAGDAVRDEPRAGDAVREGPRAAGAASRRDVLERLARHEMSADEAAVALRSIAAAPSSGQRD
ncbi:MAG: hypothetical protein QOH61_1790 [Chloroflexota bacterium]|jgi:hypothetical protein|nr:hypothetical protein [Chloroflexota bacterium]